MQFPMEPMKVPSIQPVAESIFSIGKRVIGHGIGRIQGIQQHWTRWKVQTYERAQRPLLGFGHFWAHEPTLLKVLEVFN